MSDEVGLGAILGRLLQLAVYRSPARTIGLVAQVIFCCIPGYSGLAAVRQAFRRTKSRRSLDPQFSVSQTNNEFPGNTGVDFGGCWSPGSSPGMIAREH
jgi:hypothetical protein